MEQWARQTESALVTDPNVSGHLFYILRDYSSKKTFFEICGREFDCIELGDW
jgi:hypothetical protein